MKFQYRLILAISICIIPATIVACLYIVGQFSETSNKAIHRSIANKRQIIYASQQSIEQYCLSHAALFSKLPAVADAYALAHLGNMTNLDDEKAQEARQELKEYFETVSSAYTEITGQSRYGLHFHLPTARSLLRVWQPKQSASDDISDFRETVKKINTDHKPITGIEIGRGGFAIRGLAPVEDGSGNYLGSVEMLSDYTPVVTNARSDESECLAVFMDYKQLDIANKLKDKDKYPQFGESYVLVTSTDKDLVKEIINLPLLESVTKSESGINQGRFNISAEQINDYSGKGIGLIVFIQDITQNQKTLAKIILQIVAGAFVFIVLIIVAVSWISNTIARPINLIISELKDSSNVVSLASSQVSSSAQKLADGASRQAAELEETSSTLEEISSQTKLNASNAQECDNLMNDALAAIEEMTNASNEMFVAIEEIKHSSDKTIKINQVIDGIAFQTNLLALNASVEAARAGEAGKGFAVVAGEVRNLAIRSKEASKDTSALLEEAHSMANNSVSIVNKVLEALTKTRDNTTSVNILLGNIATSSMSQVTSIGHVNEAVSQIDQVTQKAATGAEESASVSQDLQFQASKMQTVIDGLVAIIGGK